MTTIELIVRFLIIIPALAVLGVALNPVCIAAAFDSESETPMIVWIVVFSMSLYVLFKTLNIGEMAARIFGL